MLRRKEVRVVYDAWWHGCAAGPGGLLALPVVDMQMGWDSPGESLTGFLLVMMTTTSEDVILPILWVSSWSPSLLRGFLWVKVLSTCWMSDGGAFGVVTFLTASLVETLLD